LPTAAPAFPEVFVTSAALRPRISRDLKAKRVRWLATGLYTTNLSEPPEQLVRRLLWPIAALLFPRAVLGGRTAFEVGPARDGAVFLVSDASRDVELPGVLLRARKGPGPLEDDRPMFGVYVPSRARAYLDNLQPTRRRRSVSRGLSRHDLEGRLEADLRDRGEAFVRGVRDRARAIARGLGQREQLAELEAMVRALLRGRDGKLGTAAGGAGGKGRPYDAQRLELFGRLHAELLRQSPVSRPDPGRDGEKRVLPFFEAYFSNVLEGAAIEVDAAAAVVLQGRKPAKGAGDARDVLGTFQVVADRAEMSRTPKTAEELLLLLRSRHARVVEARPDAMPGVFKTVANRAGSTSFVAPDEVVGTLSLGFELVRSLPDAFQRAVFTMVLVAEVHPFADGNGRVARIMMNAELAAAGERRIVVPTVSRGSYLAGLKALSSNGTAGALIRSLDFLQRYAVGTDFSTYAGAKRQLEETRAFMDSRDAEAEGVRLVLP